MDSLACYELVREQFLFRTGATSALQMSNALWAKRQSKRPLRQRKSVSESDLESSLRAWCLGQPASSAEATVANSFVDLLQFFSVLEVASVSGAIDGEFYRSERDGWIAVLERPALRGFYEGSNATTLPARFLKRLRGERNEVDQSGRPIFPDFYKSALQLASDEDLLTFLGMLAGQKRVSKSTNWLFEADWDAESLATRLFPKGEGSSGLNNERRMVLGLVEFTQFVGDLEELLRSAGSAPLIRSTIWEYHNFWIRKLEGEPLNALQGLCSKLHRLAMMCWSELEFFGKIDASLSAEILGNSVGIGFFVESVRKLTSGEPWISTSTFDQKFLPDVQA